MTKTKVVERINEGTERHDFEVTDDKGRAVGCSVSYSVQVFEAAPVDACSYYTLEPGTYFTWIGGSTRNGKDFGALQAVHYCKSEAERFEQVAAYVERAKARAVKKWTK